MTHTNNWEEEFDKEFIAQVGNSLRCVTPWATLLQIKTFIRSLLEKQKEEIIETIKKHYPYNTSDKYIFDPKELKKASAISTNTLTYLRRKEKGYE